MEFKCLTNIETSFRQLRMYAFVFVGICAVVTVAAVWLSYSFAERQRQKIYVLDNGRSLMVALSQDLAQNRPVEAREHVRRFHELFFTLSPDKAAIESNLNRALLMADRSALSYYKALSEKGFFNRLIAGGISQTVRIDSIRCNFDSYPYQVTTYARQRIMRESTITERSLVTTCRLINAVRSDNNPQGFLLENLNVIENKDLATYDRWQAARTNTLCEAVAAPPTRPSGAPPAAVHRSCGAAAFRRCRYVDAAAGRLILNIKFR